MAHTLSQPKPIGGISLKIKQGRLVREETIQWWLTADSTNPNKEEFLSVTGYPIPGRTVSGFAGICISSTCDRVAGNRLLWSVVATFSSNVEDQSGFNPNDLDTAPEDWIPVRELSLEPFDVVRTRDLDNRAFTNGAGVPYDPTPALTDDIIKWDFFQFEPITGPGAVSDDMVADRSNTINSLAFLTRAPDTLLLRVRKSAVGYYYGALRRLTEYSLVYNPRTWHEELPNVGNSFRVNGVMYPYRYYVLNPDGKLDPKASEAIHTGPLGNRDVPLNTAFVGNTANPGEGGVITGASMGDDGPSGGIIRKDGQIYALSPTPGTLFYIQRRKYPRLNFSTFLRVV